MRSNLFSVALLTVAVTGIGFIAQREAQADTPKLTWDSSGYFRTRAVALTNLAPVDASTFVLPGGEPYDIPEINRTSYMMSRLRITPRLSWEDMATLHFQIDALDDVIWGDNNGLSAAPLFAIDGTDQHFLSDRRDALKLHKAWVEFKIPVGVMRVGRMPSHWGMGLLANGGGNAFLDPDPTRPKHIPQRESLDTYFDDDFGDNHFGSVTDRVLFITKPLSIYKTLTGKADTTSKLVMGYAYDKISEAPLLGGESEGSRFRPLGQQGFISRPGDDVSEHVGFVVWNDPYAQFGGPLARDTDELRIGTYFVWRHADRSSTQPSDLNSSENCGEFDGELVPCVDTGSDIFISDFWGRLRYGPFYAETEVLAIFGETFGGVPFPSTNRKKNAEISGGVARLGYMATNDRGEDLFDVILEAGHASGDDSLPDQDFKQRALHPDYNVGLILFEETLRELSARTYGPPFLSAENPNGAEGFFSNGGVINSNYLHPKFRYHIPSKKLTLVTSVLMAWADTLAIEGPAMIYDDQTNSSYLGTEVDVAVKARFSGGMQFSLEAGYLKFGEALKSALPNADNSISVQSRVAFVW